MGKAAQERCAMQRITLGLSPYLSVAGGAGAFKIQSHKNGEELLGWTSGLKLIVLMAETWFQSWTVSETAGTI